MNLTMLKAKLHRVTVTEANLNYVGSITIDSDLMAAANILPNEQVHVVDNNNGSRLVTYAIPGAGRFRCDLPERLSRQVGSTRRYCHYYGLRYDERGGS